YGDHLRHRAVLVVPAVRLPVDQLGGELAVRGRHGEQLDAADPLRGAALVHVDVGALGADHRAPAVGDRLEGDYVGAGAVEDRERLGRGAEVAAHDLLEVLGVGVLAVRHLVPAVGQGQGGEHLRVGAGVVVAGEAADVRVVMTTRVGPRRVHGFSVSHRRFPFTSAAGFSQTPTMASARSLTSVKPANFA